MTEDKRYPKYTGKIQLRNEDHTSAGKISLWDNLEPTSDKSPLLTGEITVMDRIYSVSLWKYTPK